MGECGGETEVDAHLSCSGTGPCFIIKKRNKLLRIAHLHMRIVKIQRVGLGARILPIHVERDKQVKSTTFFYFC